MEDSNPPAHCSVREIARRLGLAASTVSMALNDHPRVARKTRLRVKTAAEKLGYRPNPLLSALLSPKKGNPKPHELIPIALLTDVPAPGPSKRSPRFGASYFAALEEGAAEHGFRVTWHDLARYDSPAQLDRMLYHRGYRALLICAWHGHRDRFFEMRLDRYVVVGLGDTTCDLPMLTIRMNIAAGVRMVWESLRGPAPRRVLAGLLLEPHRTRKDYEMIGAFEAARQLAPAPWELEITTSHAQLIERLHAFEPDHLIAYNRAQRLVAAKEGFRIPQQLGCTQMQVSPRQEARGLRTPHRAIARRGLGVVDRLLRAGKTGPDADAGEILLEPEWWGGWNSTDEGTPPVSSPAVLPSRRGSVRGRRSASSQ